MTFVRMPDGTLLKLSGSGPYTFATVWLDERNEAVPYRYLRRDGRVLTIRERDRIDDCYFNDREHCKAVALGGVGVEPEDW